MRWPGATGLAVLAAVGLALAAVIGYRTLQSDPTQDLVQDRAWLLDREQQDRISAYHAAILDAYDIDFRVATVPGTPDLNRLAAETFAAQTVGAQSGSGRGLLLIIAPGADRVRLEVGRSLEPVFTDAFVAYVEQRQMVPFFQADRVADGILATTELIANRAADGLAGMAFNDPADGAPEPSTGAGAATGARIGSGYRRPAGRPVEAPAPGGGPLRVVDAYLAAMAAENAAPDLEIYTEATRDMLRDWVVTRAQMRNISETYKSCGAARLFQRGAVAVARYDVGKRQCAPFFLRRGGERWQLDLTAMSGTIRFNHKNQWHFGAGPDPDFAFAFTDWRLDSHGFPHPKR